MEKLSSRAL